MEKDDFLKNTINSRQFKFDATGVKKLGFKPNETYDEIALAIILRMNWEV
jgi:hypothetical protein